MRDPAQRELGRWIRLREEEAASRGDGLTVASMEAISAVRGASAEAKVVRVCEPKLLLDS